MAHNNLTAEEAKSLEAAFDERRVALAARCERYRHQGLLLSEIAEILNAEGLTTKKGHPWTYANVSTLLKHPNPPVSMNKAISKTTGRSKTKTKNSDKTLSWVSGTFPHLEEWRKLGDAWVHSRQKAVGECLRGINKFLEFLGTQNLPAEPELFMRYNAPVPDFYHVAWGNAVSKGNIAANNKVHQFLEWVLTQPDFCVEDDDGHLRTSPAFSNPVSQLSAEGLPAHSESVRPTLPYGYVDEIRKMIAQGPSFSDWKWAQNALGISKETIAHNKGQPIPEDEKDPATGEKISSIWYQVSPELIDKSDPDCVWRSRTRTNNYKKKEVVYEIWSPVRWVSILLKLQLPLRTFQVRMLDSGEADTFTWQEGNWILNESTLALGTATRPYSNGVFLRANNLIDGEAKVVLHINTNKTDDSGKFGSAKGYNVPWVVGGAYHQDPFYWLEKLRRWQSKYNPLNRLTKWSDLDARHLPVKADIQLASYPDTAFLFRTPETGARPHSNGPKLKSKHPKRADLPVTQAMLERPWFRCLEELQKRIARRGETLKSGQPIRLIPSEEEGKSASTTFFSLHCLRVSLITALAVEGKVPLVILQKIAGHSRLLMTLYYCKPGAQKAAEAIHAGVQRLNDSAEQTIVDWMANTEISSIVKDALANCPITLRTAVAESIGLRTPAGWMAMLDGLCLAGGNNSERDASGCHNGGENIGNATAPRHAPVVGGARNCPMCRWFVTRPYFLPQLATRWNNVSFHCNDAREQVIVAEERFRAIDDERAAAYAEDRPFPSQGKHLEAQRALENAVQKFDELVHTLAAITRIIESCRLALSNGDGTALMAVGGGAEFDYAIEEVDSELLQVSGVSEGALLYPDLNPGKAVLRQGQLLDAALMRENVTPVFLTLTEHEQQLVGSAFLQQLSSQMNPQNIGYGRYQVISAINAGQSITERLGIDIADALRVAVIESKPRRVIPIENLRSLEPS